VVVVVVVGEAVVVVVVTGVGASFGFGGFGGLTFASFSAVLWPWCACDGGTAGVAGVAGRAFGGLAGVAGIAGVALSCVLVCGFCFGAGAGADGSGALADGGVEGVPEGVPPAAALPPLGGDVGGGVEGVGDGVGVPGVGEGTGVDGVPPPPTTPDDRPGDVGPLAGIPPEPAEAKIGVKPPKIGGVRAFDFTTCGAGETRTGTLRTWLLGTANSRLTERSSVVKACIQSCADATAPAATALT
jgi:hypothetical protein